MQVAMVPIDGLYMRAIIVNDLTPNKPCENCTKPTYYHPLLVKEDPDWCINCNDEHYRGHMTDKELGEWTNEQMVEGNAVAIVQQEIYNQILRRSRNKNGFFIGR